MTLEEKLARFIVETKYEDIPAEDIRVAERQVYVALGAAIAGRDAEGCRAMVDYAKSLGGAQQATVYFWGGKIPAAQAALVNACMARALDICDHINPGMHIGSALVPAAIACAEYLGGVSGKELIEAVAIGSEVALALNLKDMETDGFDPSGVIAIFAPAAACAKLMKLDVHQTWNALALAYNRCGSSFQSEVDGALSVRVMEGLISRCGVESAIWASRGITGPTNFLCGVYGYYHNFGRDHYDAAAYEEIGNQLGKKWHLTLLSFKKFPSCGHTQGSTELILNLMKENNIRREDIDTIELVLNPFTDRLVGKEFVPGDNPKVDAQFNVGYCVANAVCRAPVVLKHFETEYILNEDVLTFLKEHVVKKVDPELHKRGHYSSAINIRLKTGVCVSGSIDVPPGSPGNEITEQEFENRFYDCVEFGGCDFIKNRADEINKTLKHAASLGNVSEIVGCLTE